MRGLIFLKRLNLLLLSIAASIVWASEDQCHNTGQLIAFNPDTEVWVDITRQLAIQAAQTDLKGFCEWNRMDRATGFFFYDNPRGLGNYRMTKFTGNRDQAAKTMADRQSHLRYLTPWQGSLSGHPWLKSGTGSGFSSTCQDVSALECVPQLLPLLARDDLRGDYLTPQYESLGPINASTWQLLGACGLVTGLLGAQGCANASRDSLTFLEFHSRSDGTAAITGVPLLNHALKNQRTTRALQKVTTELWAKIEAKNFSPSDNIFSDLTKALIGVGFSVVEAQKESIKILGAIATGGPNFFLRANSVEIAEFPESCLAPETCNLNGVFLQAIAEGMVHADTIKMENNQTGLYSLPENANYNCDSGKSYHFWMSAAVTQDLMQLGHSEASARSAAFVSQLGYQMKGREEMVGSGGFAHLQRPRYGAVENGVRIDLNLASAGAAFGAAQGVVNPELGLDLEKGLIEIMRQGSSTPATQNTPFDPSSLSDVIDWMGRMGAMTAFDVYK